MAMTKMNVHADKLQNKHYSPTLSERYFTYVSGVMGTWMAELQ